MNDAALYELERRYAVKITTPRLRAEDIKDLIRKLQELGGFTDLFLSPDMPIRIKVNGFIVSISRRLLTKDEAREAAILFGGEACIGRLISGNDFDTSYDLPISEDGYECYRYRVNLSRGTNEFGRGFHAALRSLKTEIPSLEFVGLSEAMANDMTPRQGLGFVCGTTASGKSTTLASYLQYLLDHGEGKHILTYEAPIEYVLRSGKSRRSMACQMDISEYGGDLETMSRGVRNSLRRNADIVLIGETRDLVTADAAISAAMTGQFCVTTMHTSSIAETIDRFLSFYNDPSTVAQRTAEFFNQIRWIMCQSLVKGAGSDGSLVLVREWMFFTNEDRIKLLSYKGVNRKVFIEEMIASSGRGQLMSKSAKSLHDAGKIDDYVYAYIISGIS